MTLPSPPDRPAPRTGISRRNFLLGGAALAGSLVLADALLYEPRALQVRRIDLPLAKVPPGKNLRIVQVSDLHIRVLNGYLEGVAETVNRLAPEAIVLTGDYLEEGRRIGEVKSFLRLLRAPLGILAIQGNWEYWSRLEGENLRRHFAETGTTLLINERYDLEMQQVPLSIHGLDYPSSADQLARIQRGADRGRLNLLLSHVPAFDHYLLGGEFDLILSGHTHGGQVRIPLIPPFYLPRFSGRFVEGLFRVGPEGTPLYVSRGAGTSVLPVRFLCAPEITLLNLVPLPADIRDNRGDR